MEFKHTLVFKFKDGSTINTDSESFETSGRGDFLTLVANNVKNKKPITVNYQNGEPIIKNFSDLHSIEIIIK